MAFLRKRIRELGEFEGDIKVIRLEEVKALAGEFGLPVREVEIAALEERVLPRRYLRSLGTVGWEGQIKLLRSTVAVVGLGGLGGNVVEGLARMGVGRLVLIDPDYFVDHNLNRQTLGTEADLGIPKVEVAKSRISRINSAVDVIAFEVEADKDNLLHLLEGVDVVVDALDSLPARLALQDATRKMGIPMVHGAIAGYIGQVMTIFPEDMGLRAIYGEGSLPEKGVEMELGCPAATPMTIAAFQVQEVLKVLLGRGELLRKRMLLVDAEIGVVEVLEVGG